MISVCIFVKIGSDSVYIQNIPKLISYFSTDCFAYIEPASASIINIFLSFICFLYFISRKPKSYKILDRNKIIEIL